MENPDLENQKWKNELLSRNPVVGRVTDRQPSGEIVAMSACCIGCGEDKQVCCDQATYMDETEITLHVQPTCSDCCKHKGDNL